MPISRPYFPVDQRHIKVAYEPSDTEARKRNFADKVPPVANVVRKQQRPRRDQSIQSVENELYVALRDLELEAPERQCSTQQ